MRLGSDPELFLKKNGEFVPAIGLIGGTKSRPKKQGNFGLQEDNVMVEFNIPPSSTEQEFTNNLLTGINVISGLLPEYEVVIQPSAEFDPKYLRSKKACESGCDPDIDAWLEEFRPPIPLEDNWRYAGGHVHIELSEENNNPEFHINFIRALDKFLAIPATKYDKDVRRRKKYGILGAYRDKVYGVEYRTLSNFWIKDYTSFIWDGVHQAYEFAKNNEIKTSEYEKLIKKYTQ